jgi:hypothetical protein
MMKRSVWATMALLSASLCALSVSCGDDETTAGTQNCSSGICGTGGSSTTTGPSSGGGGSTPSCAWLCSPWDTQGNGDMGTRQCVDVDGCADPAAKPSETATLPALDENFYRCNVEPVFDAYCGQLACHGAEPDLANSNPGRALRTYARGRLRVTDTNEMLNSNCPSGAIAASSCVGSIECGCWQSPHTPTEWQRNFDAARGMAMNPDGSALGSPDDSQILTQPLRGGGLAHAGIKIWDTSDPKYIAVRDWINGGTLGTCGTTN